MLTEYDDTINVSKASIYRTAASVLSALGLSRANLEAELSHFEMADMSNEDQAALERCLSKAAIWLLASLRSASVLLDDYLPGDQAIIADIVLKRAVCELSDYSGQTELAKEKRIVAENLAQALFGVTFPSSDDEQKASPPAGALARPQRRPIWPY